VYNPSPFPIKEYYLCQYFSGYAVNSNIVPSCLENHTPHLDRKQESHPLLNKIKAIAQS
jgi:hypothetical protein